MSVETDSKTYGDSLLAELNVTSSDHERSIKSQDWFKSSVTSHCYWASSKAVTVT